MNEHFEQQHEQLLFLFKQNTKNNKKKVTTIDEKSIQPRILPTLTYCVVFDPSENVLTLCEVFQSSRLTLLFFFGWNKSWRRKISETKTKTQSQYIKRLNVESLTTTSSYFSLYFSISSIRGKQRTQNDFTHFDGFFSLHLDLSWEENTRKYGRKCIFKFSNYYSITNNINSERFNDFIYHRHSIYCCMLYWRCVRWRKWNFSHLFRFFLSNRWIFMRTFSSFITHHSHHSTRCVVHIRSRKKIYFFSNTIVSWSFEIKWNYISKSCWSIFMKA